MAEVEVRPVAGDEDAFEAERLAAAEAGMGPEDWRRVAEAQAELRRLQEEPDAPEAVAKLPRLSVDDLGDAPDEPPFALAEGTPVPCLRHRIPTRGIAYAYRYFDLSRLAFEELPYATVLAIVLGKLGTAEHTAAEVDTLVQSRLGNLTFFAEVHENPEDPSDLRPVMVASASALSENVGALAALPNEVMLSTDFSDASKIKDALVQKRVGMEQGFASAGHSAAMARVASYYLPAGVVREQLGGVDFYRFLKDLLDHFDERAEGLAAKLADVANRVFSDDRLTVSFTGSDADFERYWEAGGALGRFEDASAVSPEDVRLDVPAPEVRNEAFVVPTDVAYVACGYDRRLTGVPYSGTWPVASRALSYDYLWNEVRVKGGAYGAGFQARARATCGSIRTATRTSPRRSGASGARAHWLSAFDPACRPDGRLRGEHGGRARRPAQAARAGPAPRRPPGFAAASARMRACARAGRGGRHARRGRARAGRRRERGRRDGTWRASFGNRDIIEAAADGFAVVDLLNE